MSAQPFLEIKNLTVAYPDGVKAIKNLSAVINRNSVTSIIGSDNGGKTTLLRALNRMHELYPNIRREGDILLEGRSIFGMNPMEVRRKIGLVFYQAMPFMNMSIAKNVISGYSLNRIKLSKEEKERLIEENLEKVGLWGEIKDLLDKKPYILRRGQQQRLCIARTIALEPEIILLDNPTASISTYCVNIIENMIMELKEKHTLVLVPNSIVQAGRLSDYIMYIETGELIEYNTANNILVNPQNELTEKYITAETE